MSPFRLTSCITSTWHHTAHTHFMNWCKHTQIHTYQHKDTQAAADISEELQRIQGVESHLVKEDQTAGNENHWPSLVTEFAICAWNQLEEKRKQRKLAGEGNVWVSINRRPTFEMILKGTQSFIIQLILLHVYHIEWVQETYKLDMPVWNLHLFSDNSRF